MDSGRARGDAPRESKGKGKGKSFSFLRGLLASPRALAVAQKTRVGTTRCDVVHESGTHRLLRYRRDTPATWAEPVLFCYALINRPYILDLQPDKSSCGSIWLEGSTST